MKRQSTRERGRPAAARHHHHDTDSAALAAVREEILRRARPEPGEIGLNLGAGHGLVIPLAQTLERIVAVDPAAQVLAELGREAGAAQLDNLVPIAADLTEFAVPRGSVDLVVSNYVLHHLYNADKREMVVRARRWLRPGGRLVIGDMMFGRGFSPGDQRILRKKVRTLAAKGPGGVWRIAKNLVKFGFHFGGSYPAPPGFWMTALRDAGFEDVGHVQVVQEAGVVWGRV
ncbi:hypothetical protein GCM10010191_73100 [Actinomadura vinacea]|uniref:Methyltransferase type 11 domain-containing protein n=1 Tax=Actinomadura vinacea TaxID=115336 RepID=A0ABP5X5S1_9ACTN